MFEFKYGINLYVVIYLRDQHFAVLSEYLSNHQKTASLKSSQDIIDTILKQNYESNNGSKINRNLTKKKF
jgi:hypothetical protein